MSSIKIASATELWIILCIITSHTLGEKLIFPSSVIRFRWPWKWEKWFFLFFFAVFSLTIRWYLLFHALLQALWLVSLSHENSLSFWLSIFIKRKLIQIAKFLLFFIPIRAYNEKTHSAKLMTISCLMSMISCDDFELLISSACGIIFYSLLLFLRDYSQMWNHRPDIKFFWGVHLQHFRFLFLKLMDLLLLTSEFSILFSHY